MKGIVVEKAGGPWVAVGNLEVPVPSEDQVLVKSIATAINPVEGYMQSTGLLVISWPIVLGCDASGVIVKTGTNAAGRFKVGDRVCGCTRLGVPGHSTFQEYFLMDADLTISTPDSLSYHEAASIGVGAETACFGLLDGLKLDRTSTPKDTWVVIFGGAGSVGQYSIQIVKALGYKAVSTCSKKSAGLVTSLGADAIIDYSLSEDEQIQKIKEITGGNFLGVWDTVGKGEALGRRALREASKFKEGLVYATTDDWTPFQTYDDHATYRTELGLLGRSEAEVAAANLEGSNPNVTKLVADYVHFIHDLMERGKLKPNPLSVVKGGFNAINEAIQIQQKGTKGGEKVVVELQSP